VRAIGRALQWHG